MKEGNIKKLPGIYKIICKENNKVYIGGSGNLRQRRKHHFVILKMNQHINTDLQEDYNRYGKENFDFEVIEYCNKEDIRTKEVTYILKFNSIDGNFGYNNSLGFKLSDKTKKKMSQSQKGKTISLETRKKISESLMGHEVSNECREKNRLKHLGRKHTNEAKEKCRQSSTGRRHSEETKRNLSIKNSKYTHFSEEWVNLRNQGISYYKISKMYNVNKTSVRDYCIKKDCLNKQSSPFSE